jgi:hypothetical protein
MKTLDYIIKKYNLNIGKQYYLDIPEMKGGVGLAGLFAELNFNKGAEIGVGLGEYSEVLCKANPNLHLYGVDAWQLSAYPKGMQENQVATGHAKPEAITQAFWEDWYHKSVKRLAPYNCTIIRKLSMDALNDFKDNSLDFVYLDAGHDFINFTLDLHHWKDKVRVGGILAGHDWMRYPSYKMVHVPGVLMAYMPYYHMLPFFILKRRKDSMRRDYYGNWFWVKDK